MPELERCIIIERVRAGMRRARLEDRQIGRARLDVDRATGDCRPPLRHEPDTGRQEALNQQGVRMQANESGARKFSGSRSSR
jgi:DNA invertase Pin-like site-specific DNA recombinase